jgi:hypothetical protein
MGTILYLSHYFMNGLSRIPVLGSSHPDRVCGKAPLRLVPISAIHGYPLVTTSSPWLVRHGPFIEIDEAIPAN